MLGLTAEGDAPWLIQSISLGRMRPGQRGQVGTPEAGATRPAAGGHAGR
jgi:hypothetical protein